MKLQVKGVCRFCEQTYTKSGMGRHIRACGELQRRIKKQRRHASVKTVRLMVDSGDHWLVLEARAGISLRVLDGYLRAIWMEPCCGHTSQFMESGSLGRINSLRLLGDVMTEHGEVLYAYDMDQPTGCRVRSLGMHHERSLTEYPVLLMGRNHALEFQCSRCDASAEFCCPKCEHDRDAGVAGSEPGMLCVSHCEAPDHPESHRSGEDYIPPKRLHPAINSPRAGHCNYGGGRGE